MRMIRWVLRLLGGAIAAVSLLGCSTPQTLSGAEPNKLLAAVQVGDEVHATKRDGATAQFEIAAIDVGGMLRGVTSEGAAVEVPVADIASLEYRKHAPGKTVMFVLAMTFGVAAVTAECESDSANEFYDPCN
ncbi:MAG TPA: hypothetical protein VJA26_02995 [Gammaproteobacteria bacterium]|nr:hypothetical protein [Gammaproteobacteria bacterium]